MTAPPRVLRIQWPVSVAGPAGEADCALPGSRALSVGELAQAGADAGLWPAPRPPFVAICSRTGLRAEPDEPLTALELREGDSVMIEPANRTAPMDLQALGSAPAAPTRRILHVTAGPAAGVSLALTGEPVIVGRAADCTLSLDDPSLSGHHLELRRGAQGWTVRDLGSSNGTSLAGEPLQPQLAAAVIDGASRIEAGRSVLELRSAGKPTPLELVALDRGQLSVERPERAAPASLRVTIDAPEPLPGARTVLGRARGRGESETLARQVDELAAAEQLERHARQPGASELVRRVRELDHQLWERRPAHLDHLAVRFGIADQPAGVHVRHPRHGNPEALAAARALLPERRTLPAVPLARSLAELGVAGITGHAARADALARWIVLQLATLQSPREVQLAALLTPESAARWEWMKWLPHVRCSDAAGAGVVPLARTPAGHAALLKFIEARLTPAGRERSADRPADLVLLAAGDELERAACEPLLRELRSGACGAAVVWISPQPSGLPEACRLIATLEGERAAATVRDTSSGGVWEDVTIDGVSLELAEETAMLLAPLREREDEDEDEQPQRASGGPVRIAFPNGPAPAAAAVERFTPALLIELDA